ncbi:MAG: cache domain-containing protein, partial [Ignavibacteria bacterium]|nr:cache domain-containing protein [Ignavibacteria bacterium]
MVSKNKINLFLQIAITVVVLATGAIFFLKYETEHIWLDKYDDLEIIATLKTEELSNCISKELAYAELLSKNFFILDRVEKYLLSGSARIKKDFSNYFEDILKSHRFKNIIIASANGNVLISVRNLKPQLEPPLISAIRKSVKSKTTVSTDLFFSDSQKSISFDIVTPITNRIGKIIAVLVLRGDVDSLIYSVINRWPVESESGECIIVEKDGNYVRFLSNLRFLKNTALKRRIPLSETKVPAVQAVKGKIGIFEGMDYRGVDVIADLHPVAGTNWFMVCKLDKGEVFKELNYRKTLSVILIFILFFFATSSFALLHYSRSRKHYRQMYEKEKELRAVNEEFQTTLYSIGEGVITTD